MHANIKNSKEKLKVEPCEGYNEEELERIWHIKGNPSHPSNRHHHLNTWVCIDILKGAPLNPLTDTPPSQHMGVY